MVPARVESTPTAPETLINMMKEMNAVTFADFKSAGTRIAITAPPATINERF